MFVSLTQQYSHTLFHMWLFFPGSAEGERWGHGWFYHLYLIRAVSWLCATLPLVINTQTESVQSFIFCFCSARGCIQIKTETFNNTIQQLSEGTVTVQHCCTCCASDWGPLPSEKDRSVYITDHGWTSPEGNLSTQVFSLIVLYSVMSSIVMSNLYILHSVNLWMPN